jgi:hypothetical protein
MTETDTSASDATIKALAAIRSAWKAIDDSLVDINVDDWRVAEHLNGIADRMEAIVAELAPPPAFVVCGNARHDHTTPDDGDGGILPNGAVRPQACYFCGVPSHYDETAGYQHDDANAPDCFAIKRRDDAEACVNIINGEKAAS